MTEKELLVKGEALGRLIAEPFRRFAAVEASGGIVMVVAVVLALAVVNSPIARLYEGLLDTPLRIGLGARTFDRPLHFWINEGLMTSFFFIVGLEIKREILVGELASFRQSALPAAGAIGGMCVPALIYYAFNLGTASSNGWAIPTATDIAFVLGALTIVGSKVPRFLPVFLVSLAISDDIGAVLIIALFHSGTLSIQFLAYSALALAALTVINILGVRSPLPYLVMGSVLWLFVYLSGIHPTVAGVAVAMTIPARPRIATHDFAEKVTNVFRKFKQVDGRDSAVHLDENNQAVIRHLAKMCERLEPPSQRLEHSLHPWVLFAIMPLFAFANSGVPFAPRLLLDLVTAPESLGIMLGLVLGKPIGIVLAAWLAVRVGVAALPEGITFHKIAAGSLLCGIGFTMSLFIADLSFGSSEVLEKARMSILAASVIAAVLGITLLRLLCERADERKG